MDRTKTGENRYWFGGYEVEPMSGYEVVDWLFEEQDKRSRELVAEGKRKIRSDTSVGVTMVIYADSKVTRQMDAYQIAKLRHFLLHSITPFLGHEPEIVIEHNDKGFDKEGNQIGGVHWHIIDRFKDKNGDYEFHKR